jgi:hypothetical protein
VVQPPAEPADLARPGKPGKCLVHGLSGAEIEEVFTGEHFTSTAPTDDIEDFRLDGYHAGGLFLSEKYTHFSDKIKAFSSTNIAVAFKECG